MPKSNQHLPTPPTETIAPHIWRYFRMRKSTPDILKLLKSEDKPAFDLTLYGLGLTTLKAKMKELGIRGTRNQAHTEESITPAMLDVRIRFPTVGAREVVNILAQHYDIRVPRQIVMQWSRTNEPDAVQTRKMRKFFRRRCYAAGVDHVWAFDQHDKWKRFNLFFHVGVDVASRKILWLKVWPSNKNPRLACKYYLDVAEEFGGIPLLTQSDLGTENYGIANAQTSMRQHLDAALEGTLQHRWMRGHDNVKPEITWSQFRRRFAPGFEDMFQYGVDQNIYNPNDNLHEMVFHYLSIPWIQAELDAFRTRFNGSKPRFDKHRIGGQEAPDIVYEHPRMFDSMSFKVNVEQHTIDEARKLWADPSHPVFQLVPNLFGEAADDFYHNHLHAPTVTIQTFWTVFGRLLSLFVNAENVNPIRITTMRNEQRDMHDQEQIEASRGYYGRMEGQQDLPEDRLPLFDRANGDVENTEDDDEEDLFIFFPDGEDEEDEMY